jgi:hypothetical protein
LGCHNLSPRPFLTRLIGDCVLKVLQCCRILVDFIAGGGDVVVQEFVDFGGICGSERHELSDAFLDRVELGFSMPICVLWVLSVCVVAGVSVRAAVVRGCFKFSMMSSRSVANVSSMSLLKVEPFLKSFMDLVAFLMSSIAFDTLVALAEVLLVACPEDGGVPPSSIGRMEFGPTRRVRSISSRF